MTLIRPFKAVRPPRDKAYLVASRPYYSYKKSILKAKLYSNRYTFLHVINPEFGKDDVTKPNSDERFEKVKASYDTFKEKEYFIQDPTECLYIYRQQIGEHNYLGVIAGASVKEYLEGKIKIHEHTITSRENTFKRYLDICNFNAEPVLLTYPDSDPIENILKAYEKTRSEYEFRSTSGVKHDLWVVSDAKDIDTLQNHFANVENVYIADGHHRSASSVMYSSSTLDTSNERNGFFLSFFIAESRLHIAEYNRIAKDLNGLTEFDFMSAIAQSCDVTQIDAPLRPEKPHDITVIFKDTYYTITPRAEFIDADHPVNSLDTKILSDLVLNPILDIKDEKTSPKLSFVEGIKGIKGLQKELKKRDGKVAFALYPVSIEQLKKVADTNNIMPPKSTWIEPKMRSGLTIYEY
jgi:uncharacterized protein (DUF1015 family)